MNDGIPSRRTNRLLLQPLSAMDAIELYQIYQTKGVLRYFPITTSPSLEKVQRFIAWQQAHWQKYGYGDWGIISEGDGKLIGWAGLQFLPELDETEVGFLLDRPTWGKGYATEAARASLLFGFEQIMLDHIIALVHPDNLASQHVTEKCGMVFSNRLSLWGMELFRYQVDRPEQNANI